MLHDGDVARRLGVKGMPPAAEDDMIARDIELVLHHAVPGDETPIPGGSDNIYTVLEINGGLAERYGIGPGTQLQSPVYGDAAAWACD